MSWYLKICMAVIGLGILAPATASAQKAKPAAAEEASDEATPHERSFEETREFMKKHSEESKRTGKM